MRTRPVLLESFTLAYWLLRRLLELLLLLARSEQRKEVEILLLRHELQVLRRRTRRLLVSVPITRPFRPLGILGRRGRLDLARGSRNRVSLLPTGTETVGP